MGLKGYEGLTVVAELVEDQSVNDDRDASLLVLAVCLRQLKQERGVVVFEDSADEHVDLRVAELAFEALLYYVRGELELAKSNEVRSDHLKDQVVAGRVVKFQHVLNKVVAEGVLN